VLQIEKGSGMVIDGEGFVQCSALQREQEAIEIMTIELGLILKEFRVECSCCVILFST